jgi:hypothetical protein
MIEVESFDKVFDEDDEPHVEPGIRRLAAAILINALQAELQGAGDP